MRMNIVKTLIWIIGAISVVIPILQAAKTIVIWALDWRGRYDAALQSYSDIGGWRAMIAVLLSPPEWLSALLAVIGLALLYYYYIVSRVNIPTSPKGDFILVEHAMTSVNVLGKDNTFMNVIDVPEDNVPGGFVREIMSAPNGAAQRATFPGIINEIIVTNYAKSPIFGVEIVFVIQFRASIEKTTELKISGQTTMVRNWPVNIAKIEPGERNSFKFHIKNSSKQFATVHIPEFAHIDTDRNVSVGIKAYPSPSIVLYPI